MMLPNTTEHSAKEHKILKSFTSQFFAMVVVAIFLGSGASYLTIKLNEERLQTVSSQLVSTTEAIRELSELMVVLNERIQVLRNGQDQVGKRLIKVSDKLDAYITGPGKDLWVAIETLKLRMSYTERVVSK